MKTRLISAADAAALKRATESAILACGGGPGAAKFTRIDERTLRKYADHSHPMFAALDVAADLDLAAREPLIARALARVSGATVVRIEADPQARAVNAIKETGEAIAAMSALVSAGAWGPQAAKAALKEVRESMAALAAMESELAKQVERS